jgi:hypothetical protein
MPDNTESQSDRNCYKAPSQPSPGYRADEDEYHLQQVSLTHTSPNGDHQHDAERGDPAQDERQALTDALQAEDPLEAADLTPRSRLTPDVVAALQQGEDPLSEGFEDEEPPYIPISRPQAEVYFRVHPDDAYRLPNVGLYTPPGDRVPFLVLGAARGLLGPQIAKPKSLYLCQDQTGKLFFWAVAIPRDGQAPNEYHKSVRRAVFYGRQTWVRVEWTGSQYKLVRAPDEVQKQLGEPTWPSEPLLEPLQRTFEDAIISDANHSVVCHLRGKELG